MLDAPEDYAWTDGIHTVYRQPDSQGGDTMTSDQKLATAWTAAWNEYAEGGSEEALVQADSAIAERLNISLDETEQGLTAEATKQINAFVAENSR